MADLHVKFLGEEITVRELVMDDFDAVYQDNWEQEQAARDIDPDRPGPRPVRWFDRIFDRYMVSRKMLELATGLKAEDIQRARPSDLRPLVEAVREANPDFFAIFSAPAASPPTPESN